MPRISVALTLVFFFVFGGLASSHAEDDFTGPPDLPVLGVMPVSRGLLVENHVEMLMRWAFRGFKSMTVVHVDARDGLGRFGPKGKAAFDQIAALDPRSEKGQALLREKSVFFGEADLLRAAYETGMINRIVWVTPMPLHMLRGDAPKLRPLLVSAGFTREDADSVSFANGCYAGTRGGIPVEICSQETMPSIGEPVLLSMDLNYFGDAARTRKAEQLNVAFDFFKLAAAKEYRVADVVFSYSIETGEISVMSRWMGDIAVDLLRNPSIRRDTRRPPEYSVLQQADTVAAEDDYEAMYNGLSGYLSHYPGKPPALLLYKALSAIMVGRSEEAIEDASKSCEGDEGYCYGLVELGLRLLEAGDVAGANRFFAAAEKMRPGIVYDDMGVGEAWLKAGEYDKALASFERLSRRFPDYPYALLSAQVHIAREDKVKALSAIDEVLAQVDAGFTPGVYSPYLSDAAREALDFLKADGFADKAGKLESAKWLFLE